MCRGRGCVRLEWNGAELGGGQEDLLIYLSSKSVQQTRQKAMRTTITCKGGRGACVVEAGTLASDKLHYSVQALILNWVLCFQMYPHYTPGSVLCHITLLQLLPRNS